MLEVRGLLARFGPVVAVRGIDLDVRPGEIVALVGANGAGKTTALRAIMGQHRDRTGTVSVNGAQVPLRGGAVAAARAGLAIVPQGRKLFASLTVYEHLDLSASRIRGRERRMGIEDAFALFPNLESRRRVRAGLLSGGEQQMLAIARAALASPAYVLMDEPTEGLSPPMVAGVAALVEKLPAFGMGVLVTDQQAAGAFVRLATRRLEMNRGEIVQLEQPADVVT